MAYNIKRYVWILIVQLVHRVNNVNRQTSGTQSAIGAVSVNNIINVWPILLSTTVDTQYVMFSIKNKYVTVI